MVEYEDLDNESKIQQLLDNDIKENIHLDYKECRALDNNDKSKNELSKDTSSFANSDGGTIIYGIIEDKKTGKYTIDIGFESSSKITKEWIDQVLNSRIYPKINNVKILPIKLHNGSYIYVIHIPKSCRALHQASDKRFYKRYNSRSVPMEEYEIREAYYRNIISHTEYKKLQAQVREKIYRPLYTRMLRLKNKIFLGRHPIKIYNEKGPTFVMESQNRYVEDFTIWHEMKLRGDWMDIYGIGDNDLISVLDNFSRIIGKYNSLTEKTYPEIGKFLGDIVGRHDDDFTGNNPDGWIYIKEEIFSNNPQLENKRDPHLNKRTLNYLRNSDKEKWKKLKDLSDTELFSKIYEELMSKFATEIQQIDELAIIINDEITNIVNKLEMKIKNTFPNEIK